MADDFNPFEEYDKKNLVKNASQVGAHDEYNPFSAPSAPVPSYSQPQQQPSWTGQTATAPPAPPQPSVMEPSYTTTDEDLRQRQQELDRRAAELQKREEDMKRNLQGQLRQNNFPPFPEGCPIKPCFFQDFSVDIPMQFQKIVKTAYYLWIGYSCLLLLNVIGCLTYLIATSSNGLSNSSGITFGLSLLYAVMFTPCSFVCWYRPLYKAFRSDSSFNFFLFFFIFFFQFCVCILQLLGIDGWGTVGLINSSSMLSSGRGGAVIAGILMIIIGLMFGVAAALDMFLLIKVHRIYRSTGASFEKAQQEFAQGVLSNKTVQQTAGNMAASAARSTVEQGLGNRQ